MIKINVNRIVDELFDDALHGARWSDISPSKILSGAKGLGKKAIKGAKDFGKSAKKTISKGVKKVEKYAKKNPKKALGIAAGAGATALAMRGGTRDSWHQDIDWWKGNIGGQIWESTVNKVRGRGFNTNEEHLQNQINQMQKMNSASKPQPPAAPEPATPAPKAAAPKLAAQPKQPAQPKPAGLKPPKPPTNPNKTVDSLYSLIYGKRKR